MALSGVTGGRKLTAQSPQAPRLPLQQPCRQRLCRRQLQCWAARKSSSKRRTGQSPGHQDEAQQQQQEGPVSLSTPTADRAVSDDIGSTNREQVPVVPDTAPSDTRQQSNADASTSDSTVAQVAERMQERKIKAQQQQAWQGFVEGILQEVKLIEWPTLRSAVINTFLVIGIVSGTSVVLFGVNLALSETAKVAYARDFPVAKLIRWAGGRGSPDAAQAPPLTDTAPQAAEAAQRAGSKIVDTVQEASKAVQQAQPQQSSSKAASNAAASFAETLSRDD